MLPVVAGIGVYAEILPEAPSMLDEGIGVAVEIVEFDTRLVEQEQKIPVRLLGGCASGTRTIEIEAASLGEQLLGLTAQTADNGLAFHHIIYSSVLV